jgi:hypothetical protein
MGDAQAMEGWLAETDVLADADLRRDRMTQPTLDGTKSPTRQRLDDDNDVGGVAVDVHGRSREEDACGVEKRLENDHAESGATTLNGRLLQCQRYLVRESSYHFCKRCPP